MTEYEAYMDQLHRMRYCPDRLCQEAPENYRVKEIGKDRQGALLCKVYYIRDKGLLSFKVRKREYTPEYRAVLGERLKAAKSAE